MLSVVTADDHAIVRDGLRLLFAGQGDMEVVGEAETVDEAVAVTERERPTVLVLDLNLHGRSSLPALHELSRRAPATRVVVLTMEADAEYARAALQAGAAGYVLKESSHGELVRAVREVAAGQTYVHPALGARLVGARVDTGPANELSEREREVLRLLALGHTNREISEQMHLSVRTIDAHRAHVQQKLRLSTRAELVRYALEHRLLELT